METNKQTDEETPRETKYIYRYQEKYIDWFAEDQLIKNWLSIEWLNDWLLGFGQGATCECESMLLSSTGGLA